MSESSKSFSVNTTIEEQEEETENEEIALFSPVWFVETLYQRNLDNEPLKVNQNTPSSNIWPDRPLFLVVRHLLI